MQQFVIIYVDVLHRFNFARKPDKKYQLHSSILQYTNPKAGGRSLIWLQLWNKGTNLKLYQPQGLNFSSSSDLLRPFFTDGLLCIPLLSITFFTIEQKWPPKQFVCCHSNPISSLMWSFSLFLHPGPCVYIRDEEQIATQKLSGTLHFDLFPIVRLLASNRLLAL